MYASLPCGVCGSMAGDQQTLSYLSRRHRDKDAKRSLKPAFLRVQKASKVLVTGAPHDVHLCLEYLK